MNKNHVLINNELKSIAENIFLGNIYTSNHIQNINDMDIVFLPLSFMTIDDINKHLSNTGMIYADIKDALPRSINGMPCFASFKKLTIEETNKVNCYYIKMKEALDSVK